MRRLLQRLTRTPPSPSSIATSFPPGMTSPPGEIDLSRTTPARLFLVSLVLLAPLFIARQFEELPRLLEILRKVSSISLIISGGWLAGLAVWRNRQFLFWRVRRKLILSYFFLGVVPVGLVLVFVLASGFILYNDLAGYMFADGLEQVTTELRQAAMSTAVEIERRPDDAAAIITGQQKAASAAYPAISFALVPTERAAKRSPAVTAGPWKYLTAPTVVATWAADARFHGLLWTGGPAASLDESLVIRVVSPVFGRDSAVVVDLPVDTPLIVALEERFGVRVERVVERNSERAEPRRGSLFRTASSFLEGHQWPSQDKVQLRVTLSAPIKMLYSRVVPADSGTGGFISLLVLLAVSFFVLQGTALVFGTLLGRSITSAVHELFTGTERVQQGDFGHRIKIETRDQLGQLADQFNRMSASIGHLLHVQREKQRLDDELRIARDIQKSLLPVELPKMPGLAVADLCEPAREVGGDYYDFFEVGPRQLGVMIADVSGKGTSAALYMAELKGLMLALSHAEPSPRKLLIDLNRRLVNQLDNRSFITMTYAVIDLDAQKVTYARAGHTPLIIVSGGKSQILVPNGMVLGLRLPGATERFEELLEEDTRMLAPGDMIVLYTDGVTEATDAHGELFGDEALAKVLECHSQLDPAGVRERVVREVRAFVGDAEPHDDMTMVVLKIGESA